MLIEQKYQLLLSIKKNSVFTDLKFNLFEKNIFSLVIRTLLGLNVHILI